MSDIVERHCCCGEPDIVKRLREPYGVFDEAGPRMLEAADEIEELRQAIWDAFAIMGGDTDGDTSHKAMSFPGRGWAGFLRDEAKSWRRDWDEAIDETPS